MDFLEVVSSEKKWCIRSGCEIGTSGVEIFDQKGGAVKFFR